MVHGDKNQKGNDGRIHDGQHTVAQGRNVVNGTKSFVRIRFRHSTFQHGSL